MRGVTGGGRFNAMGKSHVNDIDKERCGKESDSIIFIVRVREEVKQPKKPVEVSLGNPSKGTITCQSDCQERLSCTVYWQLRLR